MASGRAAILSAVNQPARPATAPAVVVAMRNYLDGMWDVALHVFKLAAENERKKSR